MDPRFNVIEQLQVVILLAFIQSQGTKLVCGSNIDESVINEQFSYIISRHACFQSTKILLNIETSSLEMHFYIVSNSQLYVTNSFSQSLNSLAAASDLVELRK